MRCSPLVWMWYYCVVIYIRLKCQLSGDALRGSWRGYPNSSSAKFQVPSSKFQVPPSSAKFQVPPSSAKFRQVPPSSKFRQVPSSAKFRQVPLSSAKFRQVPPSSAKFRQVPPSSTKFHQVPPISSSQVPSLLLLYCILFNSTQLLLSFTEYILYNGFMLRKSRNRNCFMLDSNL